MHSIQALEADKAPELLHYILSAGLLSPQQQAPSSGGGSESELQQVAEARRRLVEALEATVPRDKVRWDRVLGCVKSLLPGSRNLGPYSK